MWRSKALPAVILLLDKSLIVATRNGEFQEARTRNKPAYYKCQGFGDQLQWDRVVI